MKHFAASVVLCFLVILVSSQGSSPPRIACDPPMCSPGCHLQKVYDGPCPGCDCSQQEGGQNQYGGGQQPYNYYGGGQQPNYYYGGGQNQNYNHGAPSPPQIACDPPMCSPGCHLQTVYDGPCPGCDCSQQERPSPPQIECDPPMCSPGCHLQKVYSGPCPGCDCSQQEGGHNYYGGGQQPYNYYGGGQQPNYYYGGGQNQNYNHGAPSPPQIACDPPMCSPGCHLQTVYDGPCPGCDCSQQEGGQNYYGGGQQPNNYNGGGQQPNNYYGGGQQPYNYYGGGQQPSNYYGGGQQPYNYYGGGQYTGYNGNYNGNYNQGHGNNGGGCKPVSCHSYCSVGYRSDGCPECVCIQN